MGCVCSNNIKVNPDLPNVLVLGLSGSGKTSLYYRLATGVFLTTQPTLGYNVQAVQLAKGNFMILKALHTT